MQRGKNVRFISSSTKLANRSDIHHHLALLWSFCDSGPAYETPYLLTYLLTYLLITYLSVVGGMGWMHKLMGWVGLG